MRNYAVQSSCRISGRAEIFQLLRDIVSYTRHALNFNLALSSSTQSKLRYPDKQTLRSFILELRAQGMSFRQIAAVVDLHWTRIQQIVNESNAR